MIFNMSGGGGAALNFKVMGGTAEPSNPAENTIWIDTDAKITGWLFSSHQPENPAEGMVWIATGSASNAEFNALKKNNITVYPLSAKQYIDGTWVNKTAKTYQNGAWVDWWDVTAWIYHNSREYTGTWSAKAWARKSDSSVSKYTPSLSFGGMGMNFSYNGYVEAVGTVCNNALLDLSDKTKITVVIANVSSNASELNMIVTDTLKDGYNSLASKEKVTAAGTYTIDVSNISSGYFVFHMYNIGEYAISSIRIE